MLFYNVESLKKKYSRDFNFLKSRKIEQSLQSAIIVMNYE